MPFEKSENWKWNNWKISWSLSQKSMTDNDINILLVHGFGASKKHYKLRIIN